ncbi:MAG: hypothetical protein AB1742_08640 [bacterium]
MTRSESPQGTRAGCGCFFIGGKPGGSARGWESQLAPEIRVCGRDRGVAALFQQPVESADYTDPLAACARFCHENGLDALMIADADANAPPGRLYAKLSRNTPQKISTSLFSTLFTSPAPRRLSIPPA